MEEKKEEKLVATKEAVEKNLEELIKIYMELNEKHGALVDDMTTSSLKRILKATGYYPMPPGEDKYFQSKKEEEVYNVGCRLKDLYVEFSKHADALEVLKGNDENEDK